MSRVSIDAGLLQMIVNGLGRDFAEGKTIRGEWVEEIEKDVRPVKEPLPVAESSDGWIPWAGGECPVGQDTPVDLRYRDSEKWPDKLSVPSGYDALESSQTYWRNDGSSADIIAYRIVRK